MDDLHVMRDLERIAECPAGGRPRQRHGHLGLELLVEALPSDEFHLDEGLPIGQDIGVMNSDDVGVGESCHRLGFPAEPLPPFRVAGDSGAMVFKARSVSSFKCRTR